MRRFSLAASLFALTTPLFAATKGIQVDTGVITGTKIINNTIFGVAGACISLSAAAGSTTTVRNNATVGCCSLGTDKCNGNLCNLYLHDGMPDPTHTNNLYWAAAAGTQVINDNDGTDYTRSGVNTWEATAVRCNPKLISVADPHASYGSYVKDGGTATDAPADDIDGESRAVCAPPDIGADEWAKTRYGLIFGPTGNVQPPLLDPLQCLIPQETPAPCDP